jgi:hypothetical protein
LSQGYGIIENLLLQDNKSAILLERNGKELSSKCTRHINIRKRFPPTKVNEYCKDIRESLEAEATNIEIRHVRNWRERWEIHVDGQREHAKLKDRLQKKSVNLKLYDKDNGDQLLTCMVAYFKKKKGDNRYTIFAVAEGYDPKKNDADPLYYPLWSLWELDEALYDCIREYYMANPGEDGVEVHEEYSGVDSDYGN